METIIDINQNEVFASIADEKKPKFNGITKGAFNLALEAQPYRISVAPIINEYYYFITSTRLRMSRKTYNYSLPTRND